MSWDLEDILRCRWSVDMVKCLSRYFNVLRNETLFDGLVQYFSCCVIIEDHLLVNLSLLCAIILIESQILLHIRVKLLVVLAVISLIVKC